MESNLNQRVTASRPVDKSVEAYKAWIMEIARRLTTEPTKIQLTEAEWIASRTEFWNEKSNRHVKENNRTEEVAIPAR